MGSSSKSSHKHAAAIAPAGGTGVGTGAGGAAVAVAEAPAAPPLVQQLQEQGEILLSFLASGEHYGKDAASIKTFLQHAAPAAQGVKDLYNSADPAVAALPEEQKHAVWAPLAHGAAGYLKAVGTLDLQIAAQAAGFQHPTLVGFKFAAGKAKVHPLSTWINPFYSDKVKAKIQAKALRRFAGKDPQQQEEALATEGLLAVAAGPSAKLAELGKQFSALAAELLAPPAADAPASPEETATAAPVVEASTAVPAAPEVAAPKEPAAPDAAVEAPSPAAEPAVPAAAAPAAPAEATAPPTQTVPPAAPAAAPPPAASVDLSQLPVGTVAIPFQEQLDALAGVVAQRRAADSLPPWRGAEAVRRIPLAYKESGAALGGMHEKHVYTDPASGGRWLFKPDKHGGTQAAAEEAAAEIARRIELPAVETRRVTLGGQTGSVQPFVEGAAALPDDPLAWTPGQRTGVMMQHVADWLVGDHDGNGANFLQVGADKAPVRIDRGQAWKFLDKDELRLGFAPNKQDGAEPHAALPLYAAVHAGTLKVNPHLLLPVIQAAEAIPDDAYRALLRPVAETGAASKQTAWRPAMTKAVQQKLGRAPTAAEVAETFLDMAVARKHGLRATFEGFFTEVLGTEVRFGQ